jgi:proteic killer suppression protein
VIASFGDAATSDIFHGNHNARTRRIGTDITKAAVRKLDMINAAANLADLKVPPSNHLEALKGDLAGFYAIRVNRQWRIVFRWEDESATDVRLTDYH